MKLTIVALAASTGIAYGAEPRIPARLRTQSRLTSEQQRQRAAEEEGGMIVTESMASSMSMSMSMPMDMTQLPAMCALCPGGLIDPDLVIPTDDQATCAMAQVYASTLETADPTCAMVLLAEALCCPPDDVVVGTIFDLGTADSNFSTLMAAVDAAGLAEALQGAGPLTVFAPNNDAFAALPAEYVASLLLPENAELLKSVLLYHVVAGTPVPGDVVTLNGATVSLVVTETGGTVNDANILSAPIAASNGAIWVIDKVLLPPVAEAGTPSPVPAGTVVEMCSFCPDGLVDPDIVLPTPDADTCGDAAWYAGTLTADNSECAYVQGGEFLCCPPAPATTIATAPPADICSCGPTSYTFVISLDAECDADTVEDNAGIGQTFCFLGTATEPTRRSLETTLRLAVEPDEVALTEDELKTLRQATYTGEIVSISFVEFDTSENFIVINQDDTHSNISMASGATVTYASISSDLDPTLPLSDQLELRPGGVQLVVEAKFTDTTTGEVLIVDNRVAWAYTNECGVDPIATGDGIAWVTVGEYTGASATFCPAATVVTTVAPIATTEAPIATTEAPIATTEAPIATTEATEAPIVDIDASMSMSMSTPTDTTLFGAKSGKAKALKSKAHAKTEKNPMAKVVKSVDSKSGKSSSEVDAKAEKAKSGKMAKTSYHMFAKGEKVDLSMSLSM